MKEITTKFPEKLMELRKEKNMTRQELADTLGISRASLEYYEKGQRTPDINMLYRLSEVFNISADYLLGRSSIKGDSMEINVMSAYTGLSVDSLKILHDKYKYESPLPVKDDSSHYPLYGLLGLPKDLQNYYIKYMLTSKSNKIQCYISLLDILIKEKELGFEKVIFDIAAYIHSLQTATLKTELSKIKEKPMIENQTLDLKGYHMYTLYSDVRLLAENLYTYELKRKGDDNGND